MSAKEKMKRAANDPLKGANASNRDAWFKESPDRWRVVAGMVWGGDRSMASELATVIMDADPSQWPAMEKKLLGVLQDKSCTDAARDWVCRMLRLIGSPACVPALKALLAEPKQADRARYALEMVPGKEVDAALDEALGHCSGGARKALEGTIAARKHFAG